MRTKMPLSKEIIALSKLPWFPQIMRELGYEPVKHGHWVGVDDEPCNVWECDVCGWIYEDDEPYYNFCPHCGAKMEESNEQDI